MREPRSAPAADLLLEIGTEELPAGFIDPALAFLQDAVVKQLGELRLAHGEVMAEGTPRRLVVIVRGVARTQADREEEITGPSWGVAFGSADTSVRSGITPAGEGFLRKNGLTVDDVFAKDTKKGPMVAAVKREAGRPAVDVLPAALQALLGKIPFKKTMFWGDGKATHQQTFARPVQWLLALLGDAVLPLQYAGVTSSNTTRGHRYHAPAPVPVRSADAYLRVLADRQVVLSRAERKRLIVEGANRLAMSVDGMVSPDSALLEIVKNLVEKPFPVLGHFEESFLQMPKELLVSEMREHQKYFAVVRADGALLPAFVVVAGSDSADKVALAAGNARVLRSRFEDGAFYFRTDAEKPLADRVSALGAMVFHRELGTLAEKTQRIQMLAVFLAQKLGLDAQAAARTFKTAQLCKCDLVTGVVNEFPELQGIMGRTYAQKDGEDARVALGIDEHYAPRHAGAALPRGDEGALVGVADRIDTLVGIMGIGKAPTASADPFALRRAAIAVTHIMIDRNWRVRLTDVVVAGVSAYRAQHKLANVADTALVKQVVELVRGRVRGVLIERCEAQGLAGASDIVDAALAARGGVESLPDLYDSVVALAELRAQDTAAFVSLCATFKRVGNILKQARAEGDLVDGTPRVGRAALTHAAELALIARLGAVTGAPGTTGIDGRRAALRAAAALRPDVDAFFTGVMVMAEDRAVRAARLGLLADIEAVFADVADFTKVQLEVQ